MTVMPYKPWFAQPDRAMLPAAVGRGNRMLIAVTIAIAVEALAALSALVTGALFLASTFALRALRNVPTVDGIRIINAINLATAKPITLLLSGAAPLCLAAALAWFVDWDRMEERAVVMAIAGGVIYGLGVILVTVERSMPLNRFLGTATEASGDMIWRIYRRDWGLWNHVRIAACTAAGVLLITAVVLHTVHAIVWRDPSPIDFRWPDDCPYCSQVPAPKPG